MKTIIDLSNNSNSSNNVTAKSVLRSIRIVYYMEFLGVLAFLGVALYQSKGDVKFIFNTRDSLLLSCFILTLSAIPIGFYISKTVWKKISLQDNLKEKLAKFQTGSTLRLGICGGVGLFATICFLLSYNFVFLLVTIITLIIIIAIYPSIQIIRSVANLTQSEIDDLK